MVRQVCNVCSGPLQRSNETPKQINSTSNLNASQTPDSGPPPSPPSPPTDERADEVSESQPSETFK